MKIQVAILYFLGLLAGLRRNEYLCHSVHRLNDYEIVDEGGVIVFDIEGLFGKSYDFEDDDKSESSKLLDYDDSLQFSVSIVTPNRKEHMICFVCDDHTTKFSSKFYTGFLLKCDFSEVILQNAMWMFLQESYLLIDFGTFIFKGPRYRFNFTKSSEIDLTDKSIEGSIFKKTQYFYPNCVFSINFTDFEPSKYELKSLRVCDPRNIDCLIYPINSYSQKIIFSHSEIYVKETGILIYSPLGEILSKIVGVEYIFEGETLNSFIGPIISKNLIKLVKCNEKGLEWIIKLKNIEEYLVHRVKEDVFEDVILRCTKSDQKCIHYNDKVNPFMNSTWRHWKLKREGDKLFKIFIVVRIKIDMKIIESKTSFYEIDIENNCASDLRKYRHGTLNIDSLKEKKGHIRSIVINIWIIWGTGILLFALSIGLFIYNLKHREANDVSKNKINNANNQLKN